MYLNPMTPFLSLISNPGLKNISNSLYSKAGLTLLGDQPHLTQSVTDYLRLAKSIRAFRSRMHSNALPLDYGQRRRMVRQWAKIGVIEDGITGQFVSPGERNPQLSEKPFENLLTFVHARLVGFTQCCMDWFSHLALLLASPR